MTKRKAPASKKARGKKAAPAKRKQGRPSLKTPALCDEIVERLAKGEPLAQICRTPGFPGVTTVWDWEKADAKFSERIARAREAGYDMIAADALDIADYGVNDVVKDENGGVVVNHDVIQRSRLRVDTRLKLLAKWDPKRYGDRQQLEHQGEVGLTVTVKQYAIPAN